jgi:hypothetical protein
MDTRRRRHGARRRGAWASGAALAAVGLAVLGAGLPGRAEGGAVDPANIQVSRDGPTTGASHRVTDFSEVMLAIDPTDPEHLLGTSKFFYEPQTYAFYTGVFESTDGGHTWDQREPAGVERYGLTSDPVTMFDGAGNAYFSLLTRVPTGLDMLQKWRGGDWFAPVTVDRTTTTDKEWIAADQAPRGQSPHAGNLYMSWTAIGSGRNATRIVVARSTDGNRSWARPVEVAAGDVQGSVPAVGPDGTVYVVYGRGVYARGGRATQEVVVSRTGGTSFTNAVTIAGFRSIPYLLPNSTFRSSSMPGFAVSPASGTLFVAWATYDSGDADIAVARSADGGRTWQVTGRLNDDPVGNGVDQLQPQVAVAPGGRVVVSWFDRRLPCPAEAWIPPDHVARANFCIDTFLARSYDDGQTWTPNLRASAQTWDWTLHLPRTSDGSGFIGDYQGLAASDAFDLPFWNATANLGANPDNHQQVFIARLLATTPSPSPTPSPTATASPSPSPSPTPTASPTATLAPTETPTATATATPHPAAYVPLVYRRG